MGMTLNVKKSLPNHRIKILTITHHIWNFAYFNRYGQLTLISELPTTLCVQFLCFGNEASRDRYVGWMVGRLVSTQISKKFPHTHATSYDVARLLLMVPLAPWQNSTPLFGAAAFCATKIDDFRASLTLSSLTIWLTHSSKRRSLR